MNQSEIVHEINDQTFNFRIPMALKKKLTDRSQSTGEKPSAIVRAALKTYLQAS
jgi:predicted DNA-binding protein